MKSYLSILLLCLFLTKVNAQETSINNQKTIQTKSFDLSGTWENQKYKVSYTFKKDATALFTQQGYTVSISKYTIDYTHSPHWIAISMERGNTSMTFKGLLEIIDANTIKIEQGSPFGEHPTQFSPENPEGVNTVHILKRKL